MQKWKLLFYRLAIKWIGFFHSSLAGELALYIFTAPGRYEQPEWEKRLVEKGKEINFQIQTDQQERVCATEWGNSDAKAVLLVHGWEGRGSQLGYLVEPLVALGYRVIALDGPAHGNSPGNRTNINLFSRLLKDIANELTTTANARKRNAESNAEFKVNVVAHSFGAAATALALIRGAGISKAVFVAAPSDLNRVRTTYCQRMGFSPGVAAAFEDKLVRWANLSSDLSDLALSGQNVNTPVLIAHDPEDKEVAFSNAQRFVQFWPTAELLKLEGVGHYRILKSPEFISAVGAFFGR